MKKLQPVHRYAAYVLFGILLAVFLGVSLKNEPSPRLPQENSLIIVEQNIEEEPSVEEGDNSIFYEEEDFVDITEAISGEMPTESENENIADESISVDVPEPMDGGGTVWSDPFFPFADMVLSTGYIDEEIILPAAKKGRIAVIIDEDISLRSFPSLYNGLLAAMANYPVNVLFLKCYLMNL